jgi:hypothetical protein
MKRKERKQPDLPKRHKPQQREPEEPQEKAHAADEQKEGGKNAFKQLRHAVRKKVREQSAKIANSLVNSALKGNSSSTRIMVSLVEKKKKKNKSKVKGKRGHSLALDLASDPQVPPEDDRWAREEARSKPEPEA